MEKRKAVSPVSPGNRPWTLAPELTIIPSRFSVEEFARRWTSVASEFRPPKSLVRALYQVAIDELDANRLVVTTEVDTERYLQIGEVLETLLVGMDAFWREAVEEPTRLDAIRLERLCEVAHAQLRGLLSEA
jgi:hypothetical protein